MCWWWKHPLRSLRTLGEEKSRKETISHLVRKYDHACWVWRNKKICYSVTWDEAYFLEFCTSFKLKADLFGSILCPISQSLPFHDEMQKQGSEQFCSPTIEFCLGFILCARCLDAKLLWPLDPSCSKIHVHVNIIEVQNCFSWWVTKYRTMPL